MKNSDKMLAIIFVFVVLSNLFTKRYYFFLPTIPIYPNNKEEVK